MFVKIFRIIFLGVVLVACSQSTPTVTKPTPEVISIILTPDVIYWQSEISRCDVAVPNGVVAIYVYPSSQFDASRYDLLIQAGVDHAQQFSSFVIGMESLSVVTNPSRSGLTLSSSVLVDVVMRKITQWEQIPHDFAKPGDIHLLSYPEKTQIEQIIRNAYTLPNFDAMLTYRIPDPQSMLTTVQQDPDAIGILPSSLTNDQVSLAAVDSKLTWGEYPIVAITPKEPTGVLRDFLACLQME